MSGTPTTTRAHALAPPMLLALVVLLGGCDREVPYRYENMTRKDAYEEADTALRYVHLRTFDAGVGDVRGIAIDGSDRIALVGSSGLRVLDADGTERKRWDVPADARSVAVADDGTVFVACKKEVLPFSADGRPLVPLRPTGDGSIGHATSVVVHGSNLLVADFDKLCIHRYDLGGGFINDIGKRDAAAGVDGLIAPNPFLDMVVDAAGKLIVTNPQFLRVETYDLKGGPPEKTFGESGTVKQGFSGCCNPSNVAVTRDGYVVTAEKGQYARVKVYDRDGKMLAYIPPTHFPGNPKGMDLAVDSENRIYVTYPVKNTVMVFERKETKP